MAKRRFRASFSARTALIGLEIRQDSRMADMKYTAKDSVFSFIFRQPENTRRLDLTLHPEDADVTETDCKLITFLPTG